MNNVHAYIYSSLSKLSAHYYRLRQEHDEYYKYSLQYLAYTPESVIFLLFKRLKIFKFNKI